MVNKLNKIIDKMSTEDLMKLQADLRTGNLDRLIQSKINSVAPTKCCPVCSADIGQEHYTLIFGPPSFRQKASFDGIDCLNYFLERLKTKELTQNVY